MSLTKCEINVSRKANKDDVKKNDRTEQPAAIKKFCATTQLYVCAFNWTNYICAQKDNVIYIVVITCVKFVGWVVGILFELEVNLTNTR